MFRFVFPVLLSYICVKFCPVIQFDRCIKGVRCERRAQRDVKINTLVQTKWVVFHTDPRRYKSDINKLDKLHERALRYLYSDESSQTSTLCDRIGYSLVDRRIQNLLIIVFKTINNYPPEYLRDLFRLRDNI